MLLIALSALAIACLSLGFSLWLAARQISLEQRTLAFPTAVAEAPPPLEMARPLEDLRVVLDIRQDHDRPVFAELLKERLINEQGAEIVAAEASHDILIRGEVVCNGYSDVYFLAKLSCMIGQEEVCAIVERPPDGDRQENLCLELVSKLSQNLEKLIRLNERKNALRELRAP